MTGIWISPWKAEGRSSQTYLWSKARHVKEVEVSQVGQTDQRVFTVVFLSCGAEHNHGHLPNPTPFVRCELEFSLGAHFGKREHLHGDRSRKMFSLVFFIDCGFYCNHNKSSWPLIVPLKRWGQSERWSYLVQWRGPVKLRTDPVKASPDRPAHRWTLRGPCASAGSPYPALPPRRHYCRLLLHAQKPAQNPRRAPPERRRTRYPS